MQTITSGVLNTRGNNIVVDITISASNVSYLVETNKPVQIAWGAGYAGQLEIDTPIDSVHPIPSTSSGSEESTLPPTGTWESPVDSNVIDLVWNGGWGNGGGSSTAFSSTIANVGANSSVTFQMRVAETAGGLAVADYKTLGVANSGTTFTKTASELDALSLSVGTYRYVQVKATLTSSDGLTNPQLDNFTVYYLSDNTPPEVNASNIQMQKEQGGDTVSEGEWANNLAPYFSWTAGSDSQAGLKGYCLYIGTDVDGDPLTSKGLLGTSPVDTTGSTCQFIIDSTSIDFAQETYRGDPWLTTSNDLYYINIKAIDNTNVVYAGSSAAFNFKFDNTPPDNPVYISLPGNFVSSKEVTITWPTSGGDAPGDDHSGFAGLQYRIGPSGTWYGDSHSGTEDLTDLLANDGSYTTQDPPDFDNLEQGSNFLYFRSWDNSGNVTQTYTSGIVKINSSAPSAPENLSVDPTDNTQNAYSFSWNPPTTYTGQVNAITYCYTINTLPSVSTCTYTDEGVTTLNPDAFATQPGLNTFYIVAKDEAGNINYDVFSISEFTYSGSAPGLPRNTDVADISIKTTSNWKLAISWDPPEDVGAGISYYQIFRSETDMTCSSNFEAFSEIGTISGTTFADTGLSQQEYYYCVKACDSANNCSAASSTGSEYPDGKYTQPPNLISGPETSAITTRRAAISWVTDRVADSKVAYGFSTGQYFEEEPSIATPVIDHRIQLTGLEPDTTYYYVTKWTDEDGNTGISSEKTFKSLKPPTVASVGESNIGLNSAIINFTVADATRATILYGKTTAYGGAVSLDTSTIETSYSLQISDLDDGSTYHYKLRLEDNEGYEYDFEDHVFTTIARPRISNVTIEEVKGTAQPTLLISWESNTEVSSIINFYPENNPSAVQDEVDLDLIQGEHKMQISGLVPETPYILVAKGRDAMGNEGQSDPQKFTTSTDSRPPKITNIKIESTIVTSEGVSEDSTAQLIVSWDTDEPSTSQVEFGEGTGISYAQKTQEDLNMTSNHLVIISNLTPSKVYHLRVISDDYAGNEGVSGDNVTITPKASKSPLELIINNLMDIFGFLRT